MPFDRLYGQSGGGGGPPATFLQSGFSKSMVINVTEHGVKGDGATDERPAIQDLIDSVGTGSAILYFPPTLTYSLGSMASGYALKLPKNTSGKLIFSGYGATIKLTAGCPRFFDFNVQAVSDTFQNIGICGFTVDCNNTGGRNHVIIGNYRAGFQNPYYYNVDNIWIEDIIGINAPNDQAVVNHRAWVYIVPGWDTPGSGNGLMGTVKHVHINRCDVYGGNIGFAVGAVRTGPLDSDTANCYLDDIVYDTCRHFPANVGNIQAAASNFQIGSNGFGGRGRIVGCYGRFAGDVGIETDALSNMSIEDTIIEDAYSACFYHTNLNVPEYPNDQVTRYVNCTARREVITASSTAFAMGWYLFDEYGFASSSRPNRVIIDKCNWHRGPATTDMFLGTVETTQSFKAYAEAISINNIADVIINDTTMTTEGVTYSGVPAVTDVHLAVGVAANNTSAVSIRNSRSRFVNCVRAPGAGAVTINPWRFAGLNGSTSAVMQLNADGLYSEFGFSGLTASAYRGPDFGTGHLTLQGSLRGVKVLSYNTGGVSGRGMTIHDDSVLTISRALTVDDCDFHLMSTSVFFSSDGGSTNAYNVIMRNLRHAVWPPVPIVITPTTGVYTYRNADAQREMVAVSGGTVTLIEYSTDGTNFFDTARTAGTFLLDPGDRLRVTNSVAPTMSALLLK